MTLKEKSEELFLQFRNANLSTWINDADAQKMSVITLEYADEFAIDFGQWLLNQPYRVKYNDKKELLEIYKKEKEL